MASIRILQFGGIRPEVSSRLKPVVNAQIAHNCLLTDGALRPQAQWMQLQEYDSADVAEIRGIAYDHISDTVTMYRSFDPVTLRGEPFAYNLTVGASPNSLINYYTTGAGQDPTTVSVYGGGIAASVTYERSYDSIKPVNRIYALTRVRRIGNRAEEGTLIPIPGQSPQGTMYEGDLVHIEFNAAALDDKATNVRIYRTISGLDTGENVTNELDTNWHLVSELPLRPGNITAYIDGNSATAAPLDIFYGQNFHPPELTARYFGLTESGWFVAGSINGDIQISERYMHHAWPVDNWLRLQGEEITDLAVHKDNIYVGTLQHPYVVALAAGEAGLQAAATPFPESIPCLANTLTPAAAGAIYASGQGLVALSREGQQVISREVANAGDVLYSKKLSDGRIATAKISNTNFGTYFQGKYIGFCEGPPIDDGFYLTTTIYPVEGIESLYIDSDYRGANTGNVQYENIQLGALFVTGSLRPLLRTYAASPDEDGSGETDPEMHIYMAAEFVVGTMPSILRNLTAPKEEVETTGMLIGGELNTILVETTAPREAVETTGSLVGGTLE